MYGTINVNQWYERSRYVTHFQVTFLTNNFTNLSKLLLFFFLIYLSKSFPLWISKRTKAPQQNNIMYKKIDMFVVSSTFRVSFQLFLLFLSRKESSGLVPTCVLPYTNLYEQVNLNTNPCFIGIIWPLIG